MFFSFAASKPSLGQRLTASLAVAIVLALTVLAASPELHERLHAMAPEKTPVHAHAGHAQVPGSPDMDDDDCAVVLFSQGVLLALAILVLFVSAGKVAAYLQAYRPEPVTRDLSQWYPPLCGPPVS